jgi:hypothetical protein
MHLEYFLFIIRKVNSFIEGAWGYPKSNLGAECVTHMVDCLPSKHEALSSNSLLLKSKKNKKEKFKEKQ